MRKFWKFCNNRAIPPGQIYGEISKFWRFGGCNPTFQNWWVEICTKERTMPNFTLRGTLWVNEIRVWLPWGQWCPITTYRTCHVMMTSRPDCYLFQLITYCMREGQTDRQTDNDTDRHITYQLGCCHGSGGRSSSSAAVIRMIGW